MENTIDTSNKEQVVEPEKALPEVSLEKLPEILKNAVASAGWTSLMPVQKKTIPYMLARRDLMVQSRTGSGKTGAFMLPIIKRTDPELNACQSLVLVPTRELARQVAKEAELLGKDTGVRTAAVYGGVAYGPQLEAFRKGAHIVVGTPGRVLDHLLKRTFSLDKLKILVFDEADHMLSMGFYPDMRRVQDYLPRNRINTYMFSATFPPFVMRLSNQFMHEPEFLNLSSGEVHVANTEHIYYNVPGMSKDRSLVRIIEMENPASAIIFCNTKAEVNYVGVVLQRFGYDADALSGDLSQKAREKIMERVRKSSLRFLVATDVAARGIDIPDLSHVILYEPPEDHESYIHRAGRTGRVGASGVAISLVNSIERSQLVQIAKRYKIDLQERELPTEEDVQAIVTERATALLEARLRSRDKLQLERMQRFVPLGQDLSRNEDEVAIIAMLLDDYYQETLHAPVPQPGPKTPAPKPREKSESSRSPRKRSGAGSSSSRSRPPGRNRRKK
jgi:ATP-dependent RNA helicase DeaD